MATKYFMSAGNWSDDSKWSTTSSAGPNNTTKAVAGDDVILDSGSGNCTLTAAAACATITGTGYTGTLAFGIYGITLTGAGVFPSSMAITASGAGGLSLTTAGVSLTGGTAFNGTVAISGGAGTYTLHTNGGSWSVLSLSGSAARTLALSSTLTVGTLSSTCTGTQTFSGAHDIAVTNWYVCSVGVVATDMFVFVAGQTLTVATAMRLTGSALAAGTITSTNLVYNGTAANCLVSNMTFTDVAYSGAAVTGLDNWYGGTLTRTSGITTRTSADIGGGSSGAGAWAHRMIGGGF